MRAIMLMFDTLNRRFLPPYGGTDIHAPNFERLSKETVTFDTCYGGSMPCMPARREIHTGRYNFLYSDWGPLEPFDDSVPEILTKAGVYTHMVTDHQHYWEDGGATYHQRYNSFELFRGQEGDKWKGHVNVPEPAANVMQRTGNHVRQDVINRQYMDTKEKHSQYLTVSAGLEFIATNKDADSWFLQIECFDPHEPFFAYEEHREHYLHKYDGDQFDWPDYARVSESRAQMDHVRAEYKALLTFCDQSLGRVLAAMDANDMWKNTMLMVCTDHGLLLGERGWWGKNTQPWYDENIHTPLFVWDPRYGVRGERRDALVQTIDFGPTFLDFFNVPIPDLMQGQPIGPVIASGATIHDAGLFGLFGGHVSVTDGRFVYMRSCITPENAPLEEYTLMPAHMNALYSPEELKAAELVGPLPFTKGAPVLKLPGSTWGSPWVYGTQLFDLETDPGQVQPLVDDSLELRMANLLVEQMRAADAPESQFIRLGLPVTGPVTEEHLLAAAQYPLVVASTKAFPVEDEIAGRFPDLIKPLEHLMANPEMWRIVTQALPMLRNDAFSREIADRSLYRLAAISPGFTFDQLTLLGQALAQLGH